MLSRLPLGRPDWWGGSDREARLLGWAYASGCKGVSPGKATNFLISFIAIGHSSVQSVKSVVKTRIASTPVPEISCKWAQSQARLSYAECSRDSTKLKAVRQRIGFRGLPHARQNGLFLFIALARMVTFCKEGGGMLLVWALRARSYKTKAEA